MKDSNYRIKKVVGKTGIEVTYSDILPNGKELLIASHYFQRERLDDYIKKEFSAVAEGLARKNKKTITIGGE